MKMAEIYHDNPKALEVPRWKYLLTLCVAGGKQSKIGY